MSIRAFIRLITRLAGFAWVVLRSFRGRLQPGERPQWLSTTARAALQVLNIRVVLVGDPPRSGLLVCNHVSYLDIPVLASVASLSFVSKADVRAWPVFGSLAARGGTIFVRRESKEDVTRVNGELAERLRGGFAVCLFPEGTSSAGDDVLPFKSSLLEPAINTDVWPAYITYEAPGYAVGKSVAYWGEMSFVSHFLTLLTIPSITCTVRFDSHPVCLASRKELAKVLHARVISLRETTESKFAPL